MKKLAQTSRAPNLLSNLKVTWIVWIISAIGLSLAVFFAQSKIRAELNTIAEMEQVEHIAELSVAISNLVHEQQKERGASAVYLASKGSQFSRELKEQRKLTDARTEEAKFQLEALIEKDEVGTSEKAVRDALKYMDQTSTMRQRVDGLQVARADAVGFYTSKNKALIGLIGTLSNDVTDRKIAHDLMLYSAFMLGKDRAGLERAIGAAGFSKGVFNAQDTFNFTSHIAAQDSYFQYYLDLSTPQQRNRLQTTLDSGVSQRVEMLRGIATSGDPVAIQGQTASSWFDASTARINAIKGVEETIGEDLISAAHGAMGSAQSALWSVIILVGGIFLGAFALNCYFVYAISKMFQSSLKPLSAIADGNTNVSIPPASNNEFGQINRALGVFKENAQRRQQDEAEREQILGLLGSELQKLASGNLVDPLDTQFPDEYERLRVDFNEAKSSIRAAFAKVVHCASDLTLNSSDLQSSANDLSRRTENQAATLEETAAALEEMTSSVASTAESADNADGIVKSAKDAVLASQDSVKQTVTAISAIESSSSEVSRIVEVIDEIAFQTNLLALNAGVEAARAGDAGRGFAVVASEVRALAERSSNAAREIGELISVSSREVQNGVQLVTKTEEFLDTTVDLIGTIAQRMTDITAATREQSLGLSELNSAVSRLDQVTQQNAAMVQQSTDSSRTLQRDAQELSQLISEFDIGGATGSKHARAA